MPPDNGNRRGTRCRDRLITASGPCRARRAPEAPATVIIRARGGPAAELRRPHPSRLLRQLLALSRQRRRLPGHVHQHVLVGTPSRWTRRTGSHHRPGRTDHLLTADGGHCSSLIAGNVVERNLLAVGQLQPHSGEAGPGREDRGDIRPQHLARSSPRSPDPVRGHDSRWTCDPDEIDQADNAVEHQQRPVMDSEADGDGVAQCAENEHPEEGNLPWPPARCGDPRRALTRLDHVPEDQRFRPFLGAPCPKRASGGDHPLRRGHRSGPGLAERPADREEPLSGPRRSLPPRPACPTAARPLRRRTGRAGRSPRAPGRTGRTRR